MAGTKDVLKGLYNATRLMGDKSISSDAMLVIEGFESLSLLTKQFPWPNLGVLGEVEIPGPMGLQGAQPQTIKTYHQGQITMTETVGGSVFTFLNSVIQKNRGKFDAVVYEGTPEAFYRGLKLRDAFFVPDNTDRDWEARSQVTTVSGTLHFHFWGETLPGTLVA